MTPKQYLSSKSPEQIAELLIEAKGTESLKVAEILLRKSAEQGGKRLESLFERLDDGEPGAGSQVVKSLLSSLMDPRK